MKLLAVAVLVAILSLAVAQDAAAPVDAGAAPVADAAAAAAGASTPSVAAVDPAASLASAASAALSSAVASSSSASSSASSAALSSALGSATSSVADPLNLGAGVPPTRDVSQANTLPPFSMASADQSIAPNLASGQSSGLDLDLDRRIKQTEDLLNRMVWQLNRETAWANSVHDIIQNYQYKYTKVLANIKKHSASTAKMRELAATLKKARLHQILESDLSKATRELQELASSSSETSADAGSYAALKERVALMQADLEKMSHTKVNKVLHGVQDDIKKATDEAIPPASQDTLKDLMA